MKIDNDPTWVSLGRNNTVTWTLQDLEDGKVNLHLEQSGIENPQALGGATYGWTNMCGKLETVFAEL